MKRVLKFYRNLILGKVFKMNISITNKCNMRCKTCCVWKKVNKKREVELSLEDFELLFDNFHNLNWVSFTGGEPFLRKDLVDIIPMALKKCSALHTISITTNGFLTSKIINVVKSVLESKLPSFYISISLDGLRKEHDVIRGLNRSFKNAMNTFKKLKEIKDKRLKVHFEYTISKFNQGNLAKTVKTLDLTPEDFIITIADNSFFYNNLNESVKPDKQILFSDIKWFLSNHNGNSIHDIAVRLFLKSIIKNKRIPCTSGKNSYYVDSYGSIYPCIFLKKKLGNFKSRKIKDFQYPGCKCYSPCESFLSLLLNIPRVFLKLYL